MKPRSVAVITEQVLAKLPATGYEHIKPELQELLHDSIYWAPESGKGWNELCSLLSSFLPNPFYKDCPQWAREIQQLVNNVVNCNHRFQFHTQSPTVQMCMSCYAVRGPWEGFRKLFDIFNKQSRHDATRLCYIGEDITAVPAYCAFCQTNHVRDGRHDEKENPTTICRRVSERLLPDVMAKSRLN